MPVALERKLKNQADKKGIKDKDAYVYGTLRKTGWKPDREKKKEKKMSNPSKLVRLAEINNRLDPIIQFQFAREYDDRDRDRDQGHPIETAAKVGAGAATLGGGYLAHRAIQRYGGYGANVEGFKQAMAGTLPKMQKTIPVGGGAYVTKGGLGMGVGQQVGALQKSFGRGLRGTQLTGIARGPGKYIGQYAGKAIGGLAGLFGKKFGSREPMIQLDENILEPTNVQKTKIVQEQFPAGKSPGHQRDPTAEILKLPFPELMKLLKQKNILQQQFPGFSKKEKLVELGSKLDGIIHK